MKRMWIVPFVIALLASAPLEAQEAGTAGDFRSDEVTHDPVLRSEVTHSAHADTYAVKGVSEPQPGWGIGGRFV